MIAHHHRSIAVVISLLAIGCADPTPPHHPSSSDDLVAFTSVNVVPMDAPRVLRDQTVIVRGRTIERLGASSDVTVPAGARVIEGRGKYLMPGLADMHTHLRWEEDLALYVARGVTTVRNMWGAPLHLDWRARITKGDWIGPTLYTAGPIVDGDDPDHDGSYVIQRPEEAARLIDLHVRAGYDFIKVYNSVPSAVYDPLVAAAKAAKLPVGGHVPSAVGMARAATVGQVSIEHMNAFPEALQREGSPVAGKFGGEAKRQKIEHVDRAKIPVLVGLLKAKGTFVCPTRTVMDQFGSAEDRSAHLKRPEMRYVPSFEKAVWAPSRELPPAVAAAQQRSVAFADEMIRALHQGGVRLVVGTDVGNPFVMAGYSVHDELRHFVRLGMTPFEALKAATTRAAELMGAKPETATLAPHQKADLVLVDGDPLDDVANAAAIRGVMVHGKWLGEAEINALLAKAEAFAKGDHDPFASAPPLTPEGAVELQASYSITWKDVSFGKERVIVARAPSGERVIRAQSYDPHQGQWMAMALIAGDGGAGARLVIEGDGPVGRGKAVVTRAGRRIGIQGVLLSGERTTYGTEVNEGVYLGVDHFFSHMLLVTPKLAPLAVGQSVDVQIGEVDIRSAARVVVRGSTITRAADETIGAVKVKRYDVKPVKGPPSALFLDDRGAPYRYEISAFGAVVRFQRDGG